MVSQKQLIANQKNALKSTGPKTKEGKARSSRNALKHGLLSREVVITEGEGAEDQQAFDDLLDDLVKQYQPVGPVEEMLVQKIAFCSWRQHRAARYETGLICIRHDQLKDDFYAQQENKTDKQIDEEIDEINKKNVELNDALEKITASLDRNAFFQDISDSFTWRDIESQYIYSKCDNNDLGEEFQKETQIRLEILVDDILANGSEGSTIEFYQKVQQRLHAKGYSDQQIWKLHIDTCREQIKANENEIENLNQQKAENKLKISALNKSAALPNPHEMNNLMRYETNIDRQLYKALRELKRCQRLRAGDNLPAPAQIDVNVDPVISQLLQ